jgi:hypothetical protein
VSQLSRQLYNWHFLGWTALCLYSCSIFNDTVSNSDHTAYNNWMTVNNELKKKPKEAVVAYFKDISHFQEELRKTTDTLSQNISCLDRNLSLTRPEEKNISAFCCVLHMFLIIPSTHLPSINSCLYSYSLHVLTVFLGYLQEVHTLKHQPCERSSRIL